MITAAIVPARNEAERIAATVAALVPIVDEVIVVDDASSDDTAALAAAAGARVVRTAERSGKGAALRLGVGETDADVVCFIDGDLGPTAAVASTLLRAVADGADMAIASPPSSRPSGFGAVERFARWGIVRLSGLSTSRPLSGQRALRRSVLSSVRIADRFGVEAALTIDAVRAGFRVVEVEAAIEHAKTGRDAAGFAHRARQGLDVLRVLVPRALRRR